MSGFVGALAGTVVSGPLNQVLENALLNFRFQRGFQFTNKPLMIPDCAIEETGRDDLQITEHPIEAPGAISTISDHAFKKPQEVTLRWAWSNSDPRHFAQTASGQFSLGQLVSESYVKDIYSQLIDAQKQRQVFTLYTGKYTYQNMVIASLGQTTSASSEYSLMTVIVCRQVIFATLSSASITSLNTSSQDAPTNGPVNQQGIVQPQNQTPSNTTQTGAQSSNSGANLVQQTQVNPDAVGTGSVGTTTTSIGTGTNPLYATVDAQGDFVGYSTSPVYPGQPPIPAGSPSFGGGPPPAQYYSPPG